MPKIDCICLLPLSSPTHHALLGIVHIAPFAHMLAIYLWWWWGGGNIVVYQVGCDYTFVMLSVYIILALKYLNNPVDNSIQVPIHNRFFCTSSKKSHNSVSMWLPSAPNPLWNSLLRQSRLSIIHVEECTEFFQSSIFRYLVWPIFLWRWQDLAQWQTKYTHE